MSQLTRLWHLSPWRPAKAQAGLHIRAVSPEPSMLAHMKYGSRRRVPTSGPTGWLHMHVSRMSLWGKKSTTISWDDSFILSSITREIDMSRLMSKPTKWLCTQQRLRLVWASTQSDQSSRCTQWVAKEPNFLHADSKDSDQTDLSLRWAHKTFCWFCHEAAHMVCISK